MKLSLESLNYYTWDRLRRIANKCIGDQVFMLDRMRGALEYDNSPLESQVLSQDIKESGKKTN